MQLVQSVNQPRQVLGADLDSQTRIPQIRAVALDSSAETSTEKLLGQCVERRAVLRPAESMSFIGVDGIGHWSPCAAHGGDELIRLTLWHTRVIRTLRDQQWPLDSRGECERRTRVQFCATI